jgi:hypothetical protein
MEIDTLRGHRKRENAIPIQHIMITAAESPSFADSPSLSLNQESYMCLL